MKERQDFVWWGVVGVAIIAAAVFLCLLLTPSCKKQRPLPPLDWANRPASCAHEPEPVGRWANPPKVWIDYSQVYSQGPVVPEYALQWVSEGYPVIIDNWRHYCEKLGAPFEIVNDRSRANVCVGFYWGPWRDASSTRDQLIEIPDPEDAKLAASNIYSTLPPYGSDYNGVCYYHANRGIIYGMQCWINVYGAKHYYEINRPDAFADYLTSVSNHEGGHWAIGLNDDPFTTDPRGLMHYRSMTQWPTLHEEDAARYMYRFRRQVSGLDCGGAD